MRSLHIAVNNIDEFLGRSLLSQPWLLVFIKNVATNVPLQQLGHETIQSAPAGCDLLQDLVAIGLLAEGALNRFHLPSDPAHSPNQLVFVAGSVCQNVPPSILPPSISLQL